MKSITVPRLKPRNPLAVPARQRAAGAHAHRADRRRAVESRRLRDELEDLHPPSR